MKFGLFIFAVYMHEACLFLLRAWVGISLELWFLAVTTSWHATSMRVAFQNLSLTKEILVRNFLCKS
jgi:hypothetical protein